MNIRKLKAMIKGIDLRRKIIDLDTDGTSMEKTK